MDLLQLKQTKTIPLYTACLLVGVHQTSCGPRPGLRSAWQRCVLWVRSIHSRKRTRPPPAALAHLTRGRLDSTANSSCSLLVLLLGAAEFSPTIDAWRRVIVVCKLIHSELAQQDDRLRRVPFVVGCFCSSFPKQTSCEPAFSLRRSLLDLLLQERQPALAGRVHQHSGTRQQKRRQPARHRSGCSNKP